MHPCLYSVIEYFPVQNMGVIYHNKSHKYVTYLILIQQFLIKLAYP